MSGCVRMRCARALAVAAVVAGGAVPASAGGLSFPAPLVAPVGPDESPAREWIEHAAAIEAARNAAKSVLARSPVLQGLLDALGRSQEDALKIAPGVTARPARDPAFGTGGVVEQTLLLERDGKPAGGARVRLRFLMSGPLSARMARWELRARDDTDALWEETGGMVRVGDLAMILVDARDPGLARLFAGEFAKVRRRRHP